MTEKERNSNWFEKTNKRRIVLEQFYHELESIGINYDIGIQPDSYRESFRFILNSTIEKTLHKKISPLIKKYERLINTTCTDCGKRIYKGGSDFFCAKCFYFKQKIKNYENINDLGFSAALSNPCNRGYSRQFFYWTEFYKATFIYNDSLIPGRFPNEIDFEFKNSKIVFETNEEEYPCELSGVRISDRYENYFTLLKHIPYNLLDKEAISVKTDLLENLYHCNICGYKSVFNDDLCLVCNYPNHKRLTDRLKKRYSCIEEINKSFQLKYYTADKDKFKYPRREAEFEKSPNHTLLITGEDLNEYIRKR